MKTRVWIPRDYTYPGAVAFVCHLSEVTLRMAMELENPGEAQEPASLMCT